MQELTGEAILSVDDSKRERVDIPEWGGYVYVRVMSGAERDDFEASCMLGSKPNLRKIRAKLACLTVCNGSGEAILAGKVEEVSRKSGAALDRIFSVAQRINRMGDKDLEELSGNSKGDSLESSGSD